MDELVMVIFGQEIEASMPWGSLWDRIICLPLREPAADLWLSSSLVSDSTALPFPLFWVLDLVVTIFLMKGRGEVKKEGLRVLSKRWEER